MKFTPIFVSFVAVINAEVFLLESEVDGLQKAIVNISEVLAQRNYLVSVVVGDASKEKTNSASVAFLADIPHVLTRIYDDDDKPFQLKSSAIVLLDAVGSVEKFNNRAILPLDFSTMHLFIHIRDGTFDKVDMISASDMAILIM